MDKYIRFSKGFNQQQMISANEDIFSKIDDNNDYYNSLYIYEKEHYEQYKATRSAAGIQGIKTNKIIYDFDSGDLVQAQRDTTVMVDRLIENGLSDKDLIVYFSGNKGFHIDIHTNHLFTRSEYVAILNGTAGDLTTLDTKVVDEQRLFRTPLTKHNKSGLYKIPISVKELKTLTIEEIKNKAKEVTLQQKINVKRQPSVDLPSAMLELKDQVVETKKSNTNIQIETDGLKYDQIDFSKMPKYMKPERWALAQGYFEAGERNSALHVLGAFYRSLGFDSLETKNLLLSAAEKQAQRTGQSMFDESEIETNIISHLFSPNYKGGIYTVENSEILRKTVERCNIKVEKLEKKVNRIGDVTDRFKDYARKFRENTLKTGIKELDEHILITTGMVVGILAAPSAGKTSLANSIARNMSKSGEHVVYFSMDMYETLLCARFLQKECGYSMKHIFELIEADSQDEKLLKAFKTIEEDLKNLHIDSRSGLTNEEIEYTIENYIEATGIKPRLVVVDYLEKIRGPFTDATANSGFVASRLSDTAKKYDTCIILLLQPQKSAGDPSTPILSMRQVKGASVIEQDLRVILTMWRPGFSPKDNSLDKYACISVVKNNMGELGTFNFHWNGVKGELGSINDLEMGIFEDDMKEIERRKAEDEAKKAIKKEFNFE